MPDGFGTEADFERADTSLCAPYLIFLAIFPLAAPIAAPRAVFLLLPQKKIHFAYRICSRLESLGVTFWTIFDRTADALRFTLQSLLKCGLRRFLLGSG